MDDATSPSPSSNSSFTAPSPRENPRFDPYAFSADDHPPPQARNAAGVYHGDGPLQLSVHPKTFLPPGTPSPHLRIPPEKAAESFVGQLPMHLHSPNQNNQPTARAGQQFTQPSPKLETTTAAVAGDNKRNAVTQSAFPGFPVSGPASVMYHNGGGVAVQTEGIQTDAPKKKKKAKTGTNEEGGNGNKKASKTKKPKEPAVSLPGAVSSVSMQTQAGVQNLHVGSGFPGHSNMLLDQLALNAQMAAAGRAPSRDGALVHPLHGRGSIPSSPSHPTTANTATSTNFTRLMPDDRRHSNDSVSFEHSGSSRPASRTSTTSSTSTEGKAKEAADTCSLAKILEIIEREKSLGSSSPCKRRRTAKPLHIQEAEEEAKKYTATNTVQGSVGGSPVSDGASSKKKETKPNTPAKKNLSEKLSEQGSPCVDPAKISSPSVHTETSHLSNDSVSSEGQASRLLQRVSEHSSMNSLHASASSSPVYGKPANHQIFNNIRLGSLGLKTEHPESLTFLSDHAKAPEHSESVSIGTSVQSDHNLETPPQVNQMVSPFAQTPSRSIVETATRLADMKNSSQPPPFQNTQEKLPALPQRTGMPLPLMRPTSQDSLSPAVSSPSLDRVAHDQRTEMMPKSPMILPPSPRPDSVGNLSAIQRTSFQGLFPRSPAPSPTHWINQAVPSPVSQTSLPTQNPMLDVRVQDLEPSLTCDLNSSWSQTADMISGNNSVSNPMTDTPVKKPKKKRSPNKPKVPELPLDALHSDSSTSIGTLPPFNAFAGFKMEPPQLGFAPNGVPHHPPQNNPQIVNDAAKGATKKKKAKKLLDNDGKERKPIMAGNIALQEPLRDNSNLKLMNGLVDRNETVAGTDNCKAVRSPVLPVGSESLHGVRPTADFSTSPAQFTSFPGSVESDRMMEESKPQVDLDKKFFIQNRTTLAAGIFRSTAHNMPADTGAMKQPMGSQMPLVNQYVVTSQGVKPAQGSSSRWDGNSKPPLSPSSPQFIPRRPSMDLNSLKFPSHNRDGTVPSNNVRDGADHRFTAAPPSPNNMFSGNRPSKPDPSFFLNGVMPNNHSPMPNNHSPMRSPKGSPTKAPPSPMPKMEPNLSFSSPEEELDDRLRNNRIEAPPKCGCLGPNYEFDETIEGPFYSQLGTARDMVELRKMMEERCGVTGNALRLEKIHYTGKEGRSTEGCPIAKWIIRRASMEEKYLCVTRKRPGHFCNSAYIVVVIVAWDGVANPQADTLYNYLVSTLTKNGFETDRRCGANERKTCACQGVDLLRRGASFSFGCSWSMYFNGCKFARSHIARKFKLKDTNEEEKLEDHCQDLATSVAPLFKVLAPDAYRNQTYFEEQASMCRIGKEKGRPFSGVTACVDFCAHSHKDFHNMQNGSTVVVTLTKHRGLSKPDDEQLHVLPLYVMDNTDEHGSIDGQMKKVQTGALEILHKYSAQARMRATPLKKPKRGAKKDSPAKGGTLPVPTSPIMPGSVGTPTTPSKERDTSFLHSQDSSQSLPDMSGMHTPDKSMDASNSSFVDRENSNASEQFNAQNFGPSEMYEKVWEYFYVNGSFPPQAYMDKWAAAQKHAMMNPSQKVAPTSGASKQGSNLNNPHQPPTPPAFQAANSPHNHPSPSALHSTHPPVKTEAANDVDQEVLHLTNRQDSRHGGRLSGASTPSRPQSVNGARYPSPLDLLTEAAAAMEAGVLSPSGRHSMSHSRPPSVGGEFNPSHGPLSPSLPRPHSSPGVHNTSHSQCHPKSMYVGPRLSCDGTSAAPPSCNENQPHSTSSKPVINPKDCFVSPTLGQGPDEPTFTMMDPTVVRCEWQDNKECFHDPGIGGVAIALCHGAVLFEVAKRELHATTALKNPNRYQPTRISLVFYQHKNLNYHHHGYYEYERKLATQRKKRIEKLMEEGATVEEAEKAVKPGRKRKKKDNEEEEEEEKIDFAKTSAAQYKYMWDTTVRHGISLTTDSIITRWIDPQPMVTGPYQRWV